MQTSSPSIWNRTSPSCATPSTRSFRRRSGERRFILAGLVPAYALIAAIILLPLGFAFYTSWFAWDLKTSARPDVFIGLGKFARVFTDASRSQVLRNTGIL